MSTINTILGMNPVAQHTRHAADIVAALLPPGNVYGANAPANPPPAPAPKRSVAKMLLDFAPGVVGAVVGAKLAENHPVLGALGGLAVGAAAMPLVKGGGDSRTRALAMVGVTGAGIAGSLMVKKHPILGYVGGSALAVGTTMVLPQTKGLYRK
jgi:hypothetical protein